MTPHGSGGETCLFPRPADVPTMPPMPQGGILDAWCAGGAMQVKKNNGRTFIRLAERVSLIDGTRTVRSISNLPIVHHNFEIAATLAKLPCPS
jgi:hypothetical protein